MAGPEDWTSLEYGHIKDWTPIPDPKKFEEDDGFLSSLYNLPNVLKKKMDTLLGGSVSAKEDIQGLANRVRIENIGTPNAAQIQANDPSMLRKIGRTGVDTIANVAKGQLGIQPNPDETPIAKFANKIAQPNREQDPFLTSLAEQSGLPDEQSQSGLPFVKLNENRPAYHGTPKVYEKVDPTLNDTGDVLGWMFHGAKEPDYAEGYATGVHKHSYEASTGRPNIIPFTSDAQNVLDLVNPNADDMAQVFAAMSPNERESAIRQWKWANRNPEEARHQLKSSHYPWPGDVPANELPARLAADQLYLTKEQFDKTPFDAIKYRDVGRESFAFPAETPLKSAISGAPLNDVSPPIKVVKATESAPRSTGELRLTGNKGKEPVASYPKPLVSDPIGDPLDLSNPDYYKENTGNWQLPDDITEEFKSIYNMEPSKSGPFDPQDILDINIDFNNPNYYKEPFKPTPDKLSPWQQNIANKKLKEQLINDYETIPGLKEHIGNNKGIQVLVEHAFYDKNPSGVTLEAAQKLVGNAKNELANSQFSKWKIEGMMDFANKHGVNTSSVQNYKELWNILHEHPVEIPHYGYLNQKEAGQLASAGELPWPWYEQYFPF